MSVSSTHPRSPAASAASAAAPQSPGPATQLAAHAEIYRELSTHAVELLWQLVDAFSLSPPRTARPETRQRRTEYKC